MLRLAKLLAVILLLAPISASPLGLGDIRLNSALNQQLDAEIAMIALGQTPVDEITVRLATREAFERAGLERPLFLSRLQFEVVPGPGDTANIRIRTDQPIREPFLNFLVEVNWPNGRLLREYTVLLDPPLFLDETPSAIQAPVVAAVETPARAAAPVAAPVADPVAAASRVPGRLSASMAVTPDGAWSYGPVQQSDTLWSIAREFQSADDSVTIEQIMMALLRNNPEAFYNNNVNELRAGHVLRIDDPTTIGQVSRAEAAAEARRQFAQWQDAKRERAGAAEPRPLGGDEGAMAGTVTGAAAADPGPRLRLSAPATADAERFSMSEAELLESGVPEAAVVGRLREDLVSALEISESARQENLELRLRLAELEEQISAMQRLLSLQDDTMAALQAGVGSVEETAPPAAIEPPEVAPASSRPPVAAPPVIPEGNLIDTLLEDPMMLGAAAFLLLMLATLGWLIVRRRQMANAALDDLVEPASSEESGHEMRAPVLGAASAMPAAASAMAPDTFEDAVADGADQGDDIGLDIMQTDDDEIDILAEADVYLAYRRFDKAEELLRDAIANDPARRDLVLKLLEVHAGSGNTAGFIAEAEALHASMGTGDEGIWDKVAVMGRRLAPEHALFTGADAGANTDINTGEAQETGADLAGKLDEMELDFSTDMDLGDGGLDFTRDVEPEPEPESASLSATPLADADSGEDAAPTFFDKPLDDDALAMFEKASGAGEQEPPAPEIFAAADENRITGLSLDGDAGQASDLETGIPAEADGFGDDELEKQLLAAAEQGSEVDWLSEIGNDLDFADMEGDEAGGDFSGLISGEDEVGTKLDLARAYIDMGDQDSARSILSEVTEEGNEDQQREANDLMRRIG